MIRFGMALMEMIEQLTKGFIKVTGRQPDNLEKLKIQQEAVQRFKEMNKVVDMQGRTLDPTKPIMGGTQEGAALKSGIMKATGAKPISVVKKNLEGVAKTLEANQRRKLNVFKNLDDNKQLTDDEYEEFLDEIGGADRLEAYEFDGTAGSAKKILKEEVDYEQSMFDQYRKGKLDPEDMAQGGRAGFSKGKIVKEGIEKLIELFKKEKTKPKGDKIYGVGGEEIDVADFKKSLGLDEATQKKDMEDLEKKLQMIIGRDRTKHTTGGRAGFKDGMSRRKFMQIMGGLAAIPIVGKFFKVGKVASKAAPIVKTPPVAGKPEWFDSLVNKVIAEGDDVTKQFATKEREIVHTVKLTDEPKSGYVSAQNDQVTVYRDLDDGTVRVEYSSVDNMSEAPVNLTFKPGIADETTRGKPADTFQADEIVPESRTVGPDDFEIEDAVDEFDNVVDLNSDVSKLKEFAGKKLTTKEIVEGIKKRKRSKAITEDRGEAADFMTSRQGDYDPSPDDFASGGIARMLGE